MKQTGCALLMFLALGLFSGSMWWRYGYEGEETESKIEIVEVTKPYIYETTTEIATTTVTTTSATETETTTQTTVTESLNTDIYLGDFCGTYYRGDVNPCPGGSGRMLIDCSTGGLGVKGSVACRYVYEHYGYSYCGSRTVVRIEVPSHPEMNGMYYVDDCCASSSVVDFYYPDYSTCPFQYDGVIGCKVWLVE